MLLVYILRISKATLGMKGENRGSPPSTPIAQSQFPLLGIADKMLLEKI